jgi:hypothetical protein
MLAELSPVVIPTVGTTTEDDMMTDSPQSKGGKARAKGLTAAQRSEIASRGAKSRWDTRDGLPKATHAGEREVGGYAIPVYNLDDQTRVISERGFLAIIGAKGRGSTGGHRLSRILADSTVKSFFSNEILVAIEKPIRFLSLTNTPVLGYPAEILKEFCVSFSKAKNSGALNSEVQRRYAEYCETLLYAFADMGVIGWIDEATGFQRDRSRDALHKILERYIAEHWAKWSKTFPDEFYEQIYRLKDLAYDPDNAQRPGFIGRITTNIVYSRLAPGVLDELLKKNPIMEETKRRARKHHQWLTRDYGHPKLKEHVNNVTFMMKGNTTWDSFYRHLQRAAPKLHETAEFDFGDDP